MYSDKLNRLGKKYIPDFNGVYPVDKLPKVIKSPTSIIVNTDTSNLQGQHWIALSYEKGKEVYAFCPLGLYYPRCLTEKLHKSGCKVIYNRKMYQMPWESTCGWHCLAFLIRRYYKHKHNFKRKSIFNRRQVH